MSWKSALAVISALAVAGACVPSRAPSDLLFVREGPDGLGLWRMEQDGSQARPFSTDTTQLGRWTNLPDRSPDGEEVVFVSGESGRSHGIYVAKDDGSDLRRLDAGDFEVAQWPAWSPDGGQILFNAGPSNADTDLYVMNADGSNVRRLTSGPWADACGRWSPDGSQIVYTAILADTSRLMTLDLESGNSRPTLPPEMDGICPDWSPDGRTIVFSSWPDFLYPPRGTEPWESSSLYAFDVSTGTVEQITRLPGMSERPRWSPDGKWITFNSSAPAGTVPFSSEVTDATEVYVVRPDGSGLERLTSNNTFDGHPVW